MPCYSLFGGSLESEIPFPDLEPIAPRAPAWTLRRAGAPPPAPSVAVIGAPDNGRCRVTLHRTTAGYRLHHACTGSYDMLPDGTIDFWPTTDATLESIQADVTTRVLPVLLELRGLLCLHGSGVLIDDVAVAFLADSGTGKSTLAMALVAGGARLVSDDAVAVTPVAPVSVCHGVHQLRLRRDSADRLVTEEMQALHGEDGKRVVTQFGDGRLMHGSAPLAAIYLLHPVHGTGEDAPVRRRRLATVPAAMALVRQSKVGILMSGAEARASLERAMAVAAAVPVYELEVVRDLQRVRAVADHLVGWHASRRLALAGG